MLRLYIPIALAVLFLAWILYRLLKKKDLKKQLNNLYVGLFFFAVWAVIYLFFIKNK